MATHAPTYMHDDDSLTFILLSAYKGWKRKFSGATKCACSETVYAELLWITNIRAGLVPLVGVGLSAVGREEWEGL
jgi:hypothetical protein